MDSSIIAYGIMIIIIILLIVILGKILIFGDEKFTNMAGFFTKSTDCDSMTLHDCLECATCSWCMGDNFNPKCVAGRPADLLKAGTCKKVYANDAWTRAVFSGDNDYRVSSDLPLVE